MLTTYLLSLDAEPSRSLAQFIDRVGAIEAPLPIARINPPDADTAKEIDP
jgi:hypothetical protein